MSAYTNFWLNNKGLAWDRDKKTAELIMEMSDDWKTRENAYDTHQKLISLRFSESFHWNYFIWILLSIAGKLFGFNL